MIIMYCAEVLISSRIFLKLFGPSQKTLFREMFSCHIESEPGAFRKCELLCSLCYRDLTRTEIYSCDRITIKKTWERFWPQEELIPEGQGHRNSLYMFTAVCKHQLFVNHIYHYFRRLFLIDIAWSVISHLTLWCAIYAIDFGLCGDPQRESL